MYDRSELMKAMAVARIDVAVAKHAVEQVRWCLKHYAVMEVTRLTRKFPAQEVVFSYVDGIATLHIQGVQAKPGELERRFNVARKQLGRGAYPQGVFLGINGNVSFAPIAGK